LSRSFEPEHGFFASAWRPALFATACDLSFFSNSDQRRTARPLFRRGSSRNLPMKWISQRRSYVGKKVDIAWKNVIRNGRAATGAGPTVSQVR
jgi:hypothetical protein